MTAALEIAREGQRMLGQTVVEPPAVEPLAAQLPAGWYPLADLKPGLRRGLRGARLVRGDGSQLPLYDLVMDVTDETFVVRETIWFTNQQSRPLEHLAFRIYINALRPHGPPQVHLLGGRCLDGVQCALSNPSSSLIVVRPPAPLAPGARLRVELKLGGKLQVIDAARTSFSAQGLEGLARLGTHGASDGDYGLLASGEGILSFANFYAVLARRTGDRWVTSEKSTMGDLGSDALGHVRLRVSVPSGMATYATGTRVQSQPGAGDKRTDEYVAAYARDFSLLASRHMQTSTKRVGDVEVRSHYLRGDAEVGLRVLDTASQALRIFERRFGEYPYADLDVVQAPLVGGAGGVEFAGLVTVASMFYRQPTGPLAAAMGGSDQPGGGLVDAMREFVVAHEVAHQYWHGVVGSDSRSDPFVDEGLAQYSAMLYMDERHGRERADRETERQVAMNYRLMRMLGHPDVPVEQPVAAFGSPIQYAAIIYGKGPLFYRELRALVGDRHFFGALRQYVQDYHFRIAPRRGFVDLLAGRRPSVRKLAQRWLEQTHGDEDIGMMPSATTLAEGADTHDAVLKGLLSAPADQSAGADDPDVQALIRMLQGHRPRSPR